MSYLSLLQIRTCNLLVTIRKCLFDRCEHCHGRFACDEKPTHYGSDHYDAQPRYWWQSRPGLYHEGACIHRAIIAEYGWERQQRLLTVSPNFKANRL